MKIVYCIESICTKGGMERIIIDKMNWLSENTSHEIILMTIWKHHDSNISAFPLNDKIKVVELNIPKGLYLLAIWRFNRTIQKLNPSWCIMFHALGALLSICTTWKGRLLYESHTPLFSMNHQWLYPLMMRRVHSIVCLTKGDAANFNSAKRVSVIPNFCSLSVRPTTIDYSAKQVVSLGRNCKEKDFPRLKRLWENVVEKYPDWQLQIHHNTTDVVKAYTSGSIFIMTSRFEGFGLVLLEAMQCGLPCIAFDCPYGPREIIVDGENGFLIPYDDDSLFIEKLTYLMEHPEERERMGKAAKKTAAKYDKTQIMNQWKELLTKL
jgi:glycosyltransferase involved in cell wall biosynthesis